MKNSITLTAAQRTLIYNGLNLSITHLNREMKGLDVDSDYFQNDLAHIKHQIQAIENLANDISEQEESQSFCQDEEYYTNRNYNNK